MFSRFLSHWWKADRLESTEFTGWHLNLPLVDFSGSAWTIADSCEGTVIFGATGSGKTSGAGRTLAKSMLRWGYGGLVLCVKPDEPDLWIRYAQECGREGDLLFLSREQVNILNYETKRPGKGAGMTENIVSLFMQLVEIASQKHGRGSNDDYWERATKQMLRNAVDLVKLARGGCTLFELFDVIQTAPQDADQVTSEEWRARSTCWAYLGDAEKADLSEDQKKDYQLTAKYWLHEFPLMDSKPRGSVVSMFTSMADVFLRGELRKRFSEGTTFVPDYTLSGKIIIVDYPVKEYNEVGQYAAVVMKYLTQKAVERRPDLGSDMARPVTIWADECQYFMTSYDQLSQTTARSSRLATVYLSQNYSNLLVAMGNESTAKAKVDSLLGNLQTKVFHQNGDPETNQWAANAIGKTVQLRFGRSSGQSMSFGGPTMNEGESSQEVLEFDCQPREFTILKKGGHINHCMVEGIVWQGGRTWNTGSTWLKTRFNQNY
jgi:hypothetical protein